MEEEEEMREKWGILKKKREGKTIARFPLKQQI